MTVNTHSLRLPLVALGVILAALPGTAAAAAAEDDTATTWSIAPATADGPDERVSLRHVIVPGESVDDYVVLTNFSAHGATFAVYPGDGVVTADGSFDLLPPGETPVDGGAWIDLNPTEGDDPAAGEPLTVEIGAESSLVVPVTISVPADASPGDHPAGIVAELVPEADAAVQLASRVGVRAHLRVDGPVVATIEPADITVTYEPSWNPFAPGTVQVEFAALNSGNVRLGAASDVALTGPLGLAPTGAAAETREVLPGAAAQISTRFAVWPLFLGFGEVTVSPAAVGEDQLEASLVSSTSSFTVWTVPWAQIALLLLIAGAVILTIRLRRRSAAQVQRRIDAAVAQAVAHRAAPDNAPTPGGSTTPDAGAETPDAGAETPGAASEPAGPEALKTDDAPSTHRG